MHSTYLTYLSSRIHFTRIGEGNRPVFCFHGYGEECNAYSFLEKSGLIDYSFYAIDLPFHGQTEWNEGLLFTHHDLCRIIEEILHIHQPSQKQERFGVMGFSLGSRIALSLYQSQPDRVEKLILLAPDGLKVNFWYWLSTQTWAGNRFFAFTMKYPKWFFVFLKGMNKLKLVNSSIFKFVNYYIGDKTVRQQLYSRWTSLRKLKPNLSRIQSFVNQHKTPVRLVYGKHDRIILSSVGDRFRKGMEEHCTISIISSGHQVLHEKHAALIIKELQD